MAEDKLFRNDIGILFRVYAGTDISGSTSVIMKVRKPSGLIVSWSASVDSSNSSYAIYNNVAGDLNEVGEYLISLEIITSDSKEITGQTDTFVVYDQFYDLNPPNRYINTY